MLSSLRIFDVSNFVYSAMCTLKCVKNNDSGRTAQSNQSHPCFSEQSINPWGFLKVEKLRLIFSALSLF